MNYKKISQEDIDFLISIVGKENTVTDFSEYENYTHDETEDFVFIPEILLFPTDKFQISKIVKYCNENKIPITPRGAGTGLSGGCLCINGGVSLSLKNMNKILFIDTKNAQVHTEPGVITQVLQEAVEKENLFYPPDPASKGSSFIGGNVAENSGGPRAVKYGVVKDFIINLEVVLPSGEIIETGANTLKNSTGYNLTQLFVGSEGTLGIITKIVARLIPLPKNNLSILVPFRKLQEACDAVSAIYTAGITPSACEFMEKNALLLATQYLGNSEIKIDDDIQAHLLIEVDGMDEEACFKQIERIIVEVEKYDVAEILLADDAQKKQVIWNIRRNIGNAVKSQSAYKEVDTVVPRYELGQLAIYVKKLEDEYGFNSYCYGHAGDGNLHINIVKNNQSEESWKNMIPLVIEKIFKYVVEKKGTLSGEHGIGMLHVNSMPLAFSNAALQLQKDIKKAIDPNLILNPNKIVILP